MNSVPARVEYARAAIREFDRAALFYRRVSLAKTIELKQRIDEAANSAASFPQAGLPCLRGTRIVRVKQFPYYLVYKYVDPAIYIYAVAHHKRRPLYFSRRIP